MVNKLVGPDSYFVLVNVPITINETEHRILTTFNKDQARVGQDILSQTHDERTQWGIQMLNFLTQTRASGELKFDTCISATLKQGEIVVRMPVNLHWRAMRMLALLCVSGQTTLILRLRDVLRHIEAGLYESRTTVNPFEFGIIR